MKNKNYDVPSQFEYQYKKDYEEDWDAHQDYITSFDAYEAMVISKVYDTTSRSVDGSKISDGYATTLAKERADRVIAKLPEGTTESVAKGDVGKAAFMDILRQKWIYPNANAQHPFLEKLNMWQFYSSVYGYMPMFYDWNVSPSGYVGPDCWLWNPRNLIPQQGRTSVEDMDYITALTWVSKRQLEKFLDADDAGWDKDALKFLIELADNEKTNTDADKDTFVSRDRVPGMVRKGICLATRYEAGYYDKKERPNEGRWCVFAPDHGCVKVREIENPHKNGRIPFVIKYSQPMFDSFYGLGDFQRAKSLQFSRDALDNFYFSGIKMNLIPPIVANANGVIKHTLDYRPGGVILETLPNSVRRLETSNAGLATYQAAKATLTGSLLSQFGSQNAALPASDALNPSQGRTPAAIDLYSDKEATRDGAELRHMEASIEQLIDGFMSMVVNIGTEDIPVALFAEDIKDILRSGQKDIIQLFDNFTPDQSGASGELRIKPEILKGVEYRFNINPSSTTKQNKDKALAGIERFLGVVGKFQNLFKDDPRLQVNWPEIMNTYEEMSDIKGAGDFVTVTDGPSPQEQQLMQQLQELQQENQELKSGIMVKQAEVQLKAQESQQDMALKQQEFQQEMQMEQAKFQMESQMKQEDHALQAQQSQDQHELSLVTAAQQHDAGMVQSNEQHKAKLKQSKEAKNVRTK